MALKVDQFAARVVSILDEEELPRHITNRLMMASARALEASNGVSLANRNTLVLSTQRLGLGAAFLFVLAASVWYLNNMSVPGPDYVDIDTAVIMGDLPVKAYLDPGFQVYLNQKLSTD